MDVAADHRVGVIQNGLHPVGKDDFRLCAGRFDDLLVIGHIVHAGEGMDHLSEGGTELRKGQHIVPRVNTGLIQLIRRDQMVAHLVGGIAQQQYHLLHACGDTAQQQRKTVAAEDGEGHAYRLAAGFGAHIGSNLVHGGVIALTARHHGFGDGHHIPVAGRDVFALQGAQNGINSGGDHIVAFAENRRAYAAYHRTKSSTHITKPLFKK